MIITTYKIIRQSPYLIYVFINYIGLIKIIIFKIIRLKLIGTAFSVLIRLELSGPGVQYIADNQLYNSIITAHAIIMIFFMVKIKWHGHVGW